MQKKLPTAVMIRVALLALIGFALMQFDLRLPIFPAFLALDISDMPGVIGAASMGPLPALFIALLKNTLDITLMGTTTGGVGELANFLFGTALTVPIGFACEKWHGTKGFLIGGAAGLVTMVTAAVLINYYILLPLFARILVPMETILRMAYAVNSNVTGLGTFIVFITVPFNLLKGGATLLVGYAVLRALKPVLTRISAKT